jgi:hypothetical protein
LKWLKENMAASHKKTAVVDGWEQKRRRRLRGLRLREKLTLEPQVALKILALTEVSDLSKLRLQISAM